MPELSNPGSCSSVSVRIETRDGIYVHERPHTVITMARISSKSSLPCSVTVREPDRTITCDECTFTVVTEVLVHA